MNFSDLIKLISANSQIEIVHASDSFEINDVTLLDGIEQSFVNTTVYFGFRSQLSEGLMPAQCILADESSSLLSNSASVRLWIKRYLQDIKDRDITNSQCLAITDKESLFLLFNAARRYVNEECGRGINTEMQKLAANGMGLNTLTNLAASKLGNSVIVLNTDYKVISSSTIFPIVDPVLSKSIHQGYCDYKFISTVEKMSEVKNSFSSDPMVIQCDYSPLRKLVSQFYIDGHLAGCIIMLENETLINSIQIELLPIIANAIGNVINHYMPYLLANSSSCQQLLYSLLIGAKPEQIAPYLHTFDFASNLIALSVVETHKRTQIKSESKISSVLSKLFPGIYTMSFQNAYASLVQLGNKPSISTEILNKLENLAKKEHLKIGISNLFFKPEQFAIYYAQACHILEHDSYLSNSEFISQYSDYSFYDLLAQVGYNSLFSYCHPALSILEKYDHDNNTDLYHTLAVYLECRCNIKIASQQLFIHRNSLEYRLLRIRDLTDLSFENSNTLFQLAMSYRIKDFYAHNH